MNKNKALASCLAIFLLGVTFPAMAKTYYVSGTGSNKNDGLTEKTAFRDLQKASDLTLPGDTVLAMNGTYATNPAVWNLAILNVTRSGSAGKPITYKAYPGHKPLISASKNLKNWVAVEISASYINFDGFEIIGNAKNITLEQAIASQKADYDRYKKTGAGPGSTLGEQTCANIKNKATHVGFFRNLIHDCNGSGVTAQEADYVNISHNVIYNTSWWSSLDQSGISVHKYYNSDSYAGYKYIVTGNVVHDNGNAVPWYADAPGSKPTDGNGIIVDLNTTNQQNKPQTYTGRTLIMGNIVYNNGGQGIHVFGSSHVDAANNTAFMNNRCPIFRADCGVGQGQMTIAQSKDIKFYNNVMYAPAGKSGFWTWASTDFAEDYNVIYTKGGTFVSTSKTYKKYGANDIMQDPMFLHPELVEQLNLDTSGINPLYALSSLRPAKVSPAREKGIQYFENGGFKTALAGMDGNSNGGVNGAWGYVARGAISAASKQ